MAYMIKRCTSLEKQAGFMDIDVTSENYVTQNAQPIQADFKELGRLIRRRARMLVDELIKCRGTEHPPFLAEEYVHLININKIERIDLGELDGVLIRSIDGYVIKINASHIPSRQNFSCAHEIGHVLLNDILQQEIIGHTEWRGATVIAQRDKERLCNMAAAELLMPVYVFGKYLAEMGLSMQSIKNLKNIFQVSIIAAAIRVQETSEEPCHFIKWKRWERRRSKGFFDFWSKKSPTQTYVRDPSVLLKAYESLDIVKSLKNFQFGNIKKRRLMETMGLGYGKNRYVISLIHELK